MSDIITFKIDGKKIRAKSGDNLLEVAKENNILIPNLCYHRKLTPTGACRLCITKIEGIEGKDREILKTQVRKGTLPVFLTSKNPLAWLVSASKYIETKFDLKSIPQVKKMIFRYNQFHLFWLKRCTKFIQYEDVLIDLKVLK